ncbi:MAG: MFS transporter [Acidimicrobiales bacterium]
MADARASRVMTLLCVAAMGTFVSQGLLYPALPLYLRNELGTSLGMAGLVMSSMSVAALACRPWAGRFLDTRGRKPFLIAGPLVTLGTAIGLLLLHTVASTLALRMAQGVANAMFYGAATATVADIAPPERRATYLARYSLFFYLGFAIGPAVAELLIDTWGFNAVWGAVIGACGWGAVLAAVALPETGERREPVPMRLIDRFFHPAAIGPGIPYLCVGVGWTAVGAFLALYARHIGMSSSGWLFAALSVTVMITRSMSGNLADRFGRRAVATPCALSVGAGLAVLAAVHRPPAAFVGVVLFAAGYAGIFPTLLAMVVDRAPEAERGQAMGSFNQYFDIGAPIGGFVTGRLVDWAGYGAGFGTMAAVAFTGAALLAGGIIGAEGRAPRRAVAAAGGAGSGASDRAAGR